MSILHLSDAPIYSQDELSEYCSDILNDVADTGIPARVFTNDGREVVIISVQDYPGESEEEDDPDDY